MHVRFVMMMTPLTQCLTKALPPVPGKQPGDSTTGEVLLQIDASCLPSPVPHFSLPHGNYHHHHNHFLPLVTNVEKNQGNA